MKIKRILTITALMITALLMVFGATSCNLLHEHIFSEWETVSAPTCTSFGLSKRVCECGYAEYETEAATAHEPVTDAAVDSTCTAVGKTEGSHCGVCGAVITAQKDVATVSHTFSEWETVSAPTCTSIGLDKRVCECGYAEYKTEAATAHKSVTDEAVAATCEARGKTEGSHCETCGTVIKAQLTLSPIGHSYGEASVLEEAFCNADGVKRYSCTNSGCSYYYDETYSLEELDGSEIYAAAVQYTGYLQAFNVFGARIGDSCAFVIREDGIIVTGNFVIDNACYATFTLGENTYDVTEVLAYNEVSHLAVLRIDATGLPCAPLCMRDPVNNETVYTMGTPEELLSSISRGVISGAKREFYGITFIQHDADMSAGYGGGPLINRFGEVIGVNVAYIGDAHINLSTWVAELELLDYSSPMTMEEYGAVTYTPSEQIADFVTNNFNATQVDMESSKAYVLQGNGYYYSLGRNADEEYNFIEGFWVREEIYQIYVKIFFGGTDGTYQYYATFTDGVWLNEVIGYLDAATYTGSETLTYDTYYGRYWTEADVMGLYTAAVYETLGWFSYCLDTYFFDLSLETFGFTSVSHERDDEALDKLNGFIAQQGMPTENSYWIGINEQVGDDVMYFDLLYTPESANASASTVATVNRFTPDGALYCISLYLDPTEDGLLFEVSYAIADAMGYVPQCYGWGYIDPNSFTDLTTLSCYVFDGMNEYEDAVLADFLPALSYMLTNLNMVFESVEAGLSVKDLGFLFYFG